MLIELRCNVMVRDFLKHTNGISAKIYMNEKTLYNFIDQWRVCYCWGKDAATTKQCVKDIKSGARFHIDDVWIYYDDSVPDGYMRVTL